MVGGIKMKQRVANTSRYASLAHQARCCCLFLRIGAQAHDSRELTRAMESVANGGLAPAGVASMRHDYDANWPRVALGIILVLSRGRRKPLPLRRSCVTVFLLPSAGKQDLSSGPAGLDCLLS